MVLVEANKLKRQQLELFSEKKFPEKQNLRKQEGSRRVRSK